MSKGNWIKLNRNIRKHFLWDFTKPLYLMAWIDILMSANYADKKVIAGDSVITVPRGSFVTSLRKLATQWQCSKDTVKRILTILESDSMITCKADSKHTIITVENYALYQDVTDTDKDSNKDTQQTPTRTLDRHLADSDKDTQQTPTRTLDRHLADSDKDTQQTVTGQSQGQKEENKRIYKNINNIKDREERQEAHVSDVSAEKKDDFHNLLDENADLMQRLREKYRKGENDAG